MDEFKSAATAAIAAETRLQVWREMEEEASSFMGIGCDDSINVDILEHECKHHLVEEDNACKHV